MYRIATLLAVTLPIIPAVVSQTFEPSTEFIDFIGCTSDQQETLTQAYIDAITNFGQVLGEDISLNWDEDKDLEDYFGKRTDGRATIEPIVTANFRRIFDPSDTNPGRTLQIRCDDAPAVDGATCTRNSDGSPRPSQQQPRAYVVNYGESPFGSDHSAYITICPGFFLLETHANREAQIFAERGTVASDAMFPMDSVDSFLGVQSYAMLHEFFHLQYNASTSFPNVGISSPRSLDRGVSGLPGLAYGAARAKYVARATVAGPQVAAANNDNFVFFLITKWMDQTFGVHPSYPTYRWVPTSMRKRADEPLDLDDLENWDDSDDDLPELLPDFDINTDDDDFYGGTADTGFTLTPTCSGDFGFDGPKTNVEWATDRIHYYCTYIHDHALTLSCQSPYLPIGAHASESDDSNSLWITTHWDEETCQGLGPMALEVDQCEEIFLTILNDCDTDTTTEKQGGIIYNNCIVYQLGLTEGTDSSPPSGSDEIEPNCKAPL